MPRLALFLVAGILACPPASPIAQEQFEDSEKAWLSTLRMIRGRFPDVAHISTDTLQAWLNRLPMREDLVLLDAREQEEYAVSHLHGARPAPSNERALKVLRGAPPNRRIVVYCSVGYRSSELAGYLLEKGYRKVYNLEGSIFRWANEGRPVFRGEERVRGVHPYDRYWGRMLKKPLHRVDPGDSRASQTSSQ